MKPRNISDTFDPYIDNPENYKWGIFYFNRNDRRFIVPKRIRWLGWTLNFAYRSAWLWLISMVSIAIFALIMSFIT